MPAENGETEQLRCSSEKDITASAHKSPDKQCHCTHPGLDAALGTRASSQLIDRWAGAEASLTPPNVWFWGIAELKHLPNFQTFFPKGSNQTRNHLTVLTARIISPYAHRLSKCFLLACPASSLYARSTTRALLSSCVVIDLHEDGFVGSVQIIRSAQPRLKICTSAYSKEQAGTPVKVLIHIFLMMSWNWWLQLFFFPQVLRASDDM